MTAILTSILLPILLPIVTGYLSTGGMQWLKKISDTINGFPSWLKPVVVFVLSTAITLAIKGLGWTVDPSDLSMLGSTDVQAVLGGLVAIVLHHTSKSAQVQAVLAIPPTYTGGSTSGITGTDKLNKLVGK